VSMKYDFLTLQTESGSLHGLQAAHGPRYGIHVHGTWGNFYENPFALGLTRTYADIGWSYASVNNSGHDGGSILEKFDDSLPEISAWIKRLCPNGEPVVIQGHSLGALKIMRLLRHPDYADIKSQIVAAVLLSPFDIVAFNGGVGEKLKLNRSRAEQQRIEQGGRAFVDTDIFDAWPLSVDTYLEASNEGGPWDLLPTRLGLVGALGEIDVPTLAAFGGEDHFAQHPNPQAVADLVSAQAPRVQTVLVDGAPHNFAGHEEALALSISTFIKSLPGS
jgi:pimeloyl-ACP methyl ester carboxylesterase